MISKPVSAHAVTPQPLETPEESANNKEHISVGLNSEQWKKVLQALAAADFLQHENSVNPDKYAEVGRSIRNQTEGKL